MAIRNPNYSGERSDLMDRIVSLNRVAKVVKGGRKFSFSALVVVGDGAGRVGVGLGKAREVPEAIRKGMDIAKRSMVTIPIVGTTIPHEVRMKWGAARIMMKPAAPGTGVISGGAMRAVIELSGIKDILTKSTGTNNPVNTVRATMHALTTMRTAQEVADLRGKAVEEIVGKRLAAAYRTAEDQGHVARGAQAAPTAAAVGAATPVEAKPEAKSEVKTEAAQPEVKADGGSEAKTGAKPEAKTGAKPEAKTEAAQPVVEAEAPKADAPRAEASEAEAPKPEKEATE